MKWTDEELDFLIDNYQSMSYKELSKMMGRTIPAIRTRVSKLNLPTKSKLDLTNKKFARLTVVRETDKRSNDKVVWECLCECGNMTETHSANLMSGKTKSCGRLAVENSSKALLKNLKDKRFGKLRVLKLSDKKEGSRRVWVCICDCGNICEKVSTNLISGDTTSCGCYHVEIMRGEKNWRFNPSLTDEERLKNRYKLNGINLIKWRLHVFERDSYTCRICKVVGGDMNAHHLNSWDAYPDGRFDIDNGATLCVRCHTDFHKKYGYGNNTREQFQEYQRKGVI